MKQGSSEEIQGNRRGPRTGARTRILDAAYDLFRHNGTRSVGIDTIVDRSGVAKMSLYRHFGSKQELILAYMRQRERLWTEQWLRAETDKRGATAAQKLMAVFDLFDEWFHGDDFDGCVFVSVLLEYPAGDPIRVAAAAHLAHVRGFVAELARQAAISDPESFAHVWHIMMKGAIVSACEGNLDAARNISAAAAVYLRDHLPGDGTVAAAG